MFFKKIIVKFLVLASCAQPLHCHSQVVNKPLVRCELASIPRDDKEALSLFFEALIRLDTFGYTLFGDKPISCEGLWKNYKICPFTFNKEIAYRRGQELWGKYAPRFNIKNFVLKFEDTEDWYGIYLIDKKNFLKVVERHIDEFRRIIGQDVTPESLFLQLINPENTFWEVLKEDDCLVGILLGYGYKNAQMFKRRTESLKDLQAYYTPPRALPKQHDFLFDFCIKEKREDISPDDAERLLSEYSYLKKKLKGSSRDSSLLAFFPEVGFCADLDDEETKKILDSYEKTGPEIMKAFLSDNFLEVVLCKMAEE